MATRGVMTIEQVGERLDLTVRQGSTLGPFLHELTYNDGTPFDLTGCIVRGQVRKTALSTEVIANFVITMAPDLTEGWYTFEIPATVTETIVAGASANAPESSYVWDSEMQLPGGRVVPLYYGAFRLPAEVTRD